jgi:hypothetical protein
MNSFKIISIVLIGVILLSTGVYARQELNKERNPITLVYLNGDYVNDTTYTNCYVKIEGHAYLNNVTIEFAEDGDGVHKAALEFWNVTGGVYNNIEIYQATYGIAFLGSACDVDIGNLTITECGIGISSYNYGGSFYLSNFSHEIRLSYSTIDFEYVVFEGELGNIYSEENINLLACVGDSLVQGSPLHSRFWNRLNGNDPMGYQWPRSVRVNNYFSINLGEGGDSVQHIINRIDTLMTTQPNCIVLAVGTVDCRNINWGTQTRNGLKADYHALFSVLKNSSINYYVCAIPPTNDIPRNDEIEHINSWLETKAVEYGYTFIVQTYDRFIQGRGNTTLKKTYDCGDGVHLNLKGYTKVTTIIENTIPAAEESLIYRHINANEHYVSYNRSDLPLNEMNISLIEGWNLISLPLEQYDTSIDKVLENIDGKWDCVQYYDCLNSSWKSDNIYRPDFFNDLNYLDHKMGFWINITEPDVNLTVRGYVPSSTNIPLYAGWNLIGYPSLTTETVAKALRGSGVDSVMVCDPAEPYRIKEVGPKYIMKPGEGYWVHVPIDSIWIIDW